jgi:hypothetical protein
VTFQSSLDALRGAQTSAAPQSEQVPT